MSKLITVAVFVAVVSSCSKTSIKSSDLAASNSNRGSTEKFAVDEKKLESAMKVLLETAAPLGSEEDGEKLEATFIGERAQGNTLIAMLRDYGDAREYSDSDVYKVSTRLSQEEIPEGDDASSTIGLARNIDVAGFAVDIYNKENDKTTLKKLQSEAVKALFQVTESGAFVGVESRGWDVCGSTIPSLFILHPVKKEIFRLVPSNTEC
jgi:hypothetical protein